MKHQSGYSNNKDDSEVGAASLLNNYVGGKQKDVEVPFSQLGTEDVKPEDFSEIIKQLHNAGADGVEIYIENATKNFKGDGLNNYLGIGNVELSLTGTFTIKGAKDGGGYTFSGVLSANDNVLILTLQQNSIGVVIRINGGINGNQWGQSN